MPFGFPDSFEVKPLALPQSPWLSLPTLIEDAPSFQNDGEKKQAFAIEWAKNPGNPFEAACIVFSSDTTSALWASRNWILDPEINARKDHYLKASDDVGKLLDKSELASRLLRFSEEKNIEGTRYVVEAKDRLKALEIYAKMMGYLNEATQINSTFNNTNEMKIVFVNPDTIDKPKIIEHEPDNESEEFEGEILPLNIKLVGNDR